MSRKEQKSMYVCIQFMRTQKNRVIFLCSMYIFIKQIIRTLCLHNLSILFLPFSSFNVRIFRAEANLFSKCPADLNDRQLREVLNFETKYYSNLRIHVSVCRLTDKRFVAKDLKGKCCQCSCQLRDILPTPHPFQYTIMYLFRKKRAHWQNENRCKAICNVIYGKLSITRNVSSCHGCPRMQPKFQMVH
jgi:hypothetical protein